MAAATDAQKKNDEISFTEKLNDFIQKNRRSLFIGLVSVIVILAALIVFSVAREKVLTKALSQADSLNKRYEELKPFIGSEEPSDGVTSDIGTNDAVKQAEIHLLLEDLSFFERKNSGFAAARAYNISAAIYADQKKWAEAEEAWTKAAKAAGKSYFAPVSLFNAAVAAEEQGNNDSAIDLYTRALGFGNVFPSAARAQFSLGRLEEGRNNKEAALEAYRSVLSKWPNDPVWPNLAQSRILILSD
jgi:tetratricopeptide (TPR) repeat protein